MMSQVPSSVEHLYETGMQAYTLADRARARALWIQVVQAEPNHARAWTALLRVCADPAEQAYCLMRLFRAAPEDPRTREALQRFRHAHPNVRPRILPELVTAPAAGVGRSQAPDPVPKMLEVAAEKRASGDDEGALRIYLDILDWNPAHGPATTQAARLLADLKVLTEAAVVLDRSITAGNRDPAVYLALAEIRLHRGGGDPWQVLEALRRLPGLLPGHLLHAADLYWSQAEYKTALELLHEAEQRDPHYQPTLMRFAEAYRDLRHPERARQYLQRVVDLGARTPLGRRAEGILLEVSPHVPRYIQTNLIYALREVVGIFLLYACLAILDAGLTLSGIGLAGWVGMLLSVAGGYLLVSATSSPSQWVFQRFLAEPDEAPAPSGGEAYLPAMTSEKPLPALPLEARAVLGTVGGVLLAVAIVLVLQHSLLATQETMGMLDRRQLPDYLNNILSELFRFAQ